MTTNTFYLTNSLDILNDIVAVSPNVVTQVTDKLNLVHNHVHETGSPVTAHYTTSCSVHAFMRVMKGGEKSKNH